MKIKVLGIIPARSGSKRLKDKNIYPVLGKPLIYYVIQAAGKSKTLDKIIVSTDSLKIGLMAKKFGAEFIFQRPKNLARDNTPDLPVFQHALNKLEKMGQKFDLVVNLRPTAPLLQASDIDKAVNLLIKSGADSVRSMQALNHPMFWYKTVDKNGLTQSPKEKIYVLNGQVDVMRVNFIKKGSLYGKKMQAFVMDRKKIIDIDNLADIKTAENLLKYEKF